MNQNQFYPDEEYLREAEREVRLEKEKRKSFYGGLLLGLLLMGLVAAAGLLAFGFRKNVGRLLETASNRIAGEEPGILTEEMESKIQTVEQVIREYYYKDDIDAKAMEEGAYRGMVSSLGDPYSAYYSEEEMKNLMDQTEGIYYGIGAYVSLDEDTGLAKISGIIENTPASEVDLRENDIIYEVDGVSTAGMEIGEVVSLIKGDEGTRVVLTIVRAGEGDFLKVEVERRKVESPTVDFKMLENGIAYIKIKEFDTVTKDQFTEALAEAKGNDMKGLVLDLRSNPGGSLDTVVDIARMILPEGMIVYTEDKYGERVEYTGDGSRELKLPMTVLINGNSASASEILAGAIKDYEVGTLVGTTTFGKGIVQRVISLNDGSAVKVTISSYYTPKGTNIQGVGIEPDVEVEFDSQAYYDQDYDNQLEEAKRLLEDKINRAE